ncbi:MAG: class I SAM-dependent methyltransferase [Aestuariivirga sp.]
MSGDVEERLADVYHATSQTDLAKTYDQWAANYDADMQSIGYVHPAVMASLVARYVSKTDSAILDAGVGTGTIGSLLHILGYTNLSGLDMSQGMLDRAAARNVYADLKQGVLGSPLDYKTGQFDAIISTGTFTLGHAPAEAFDELTRITKPGGVLIFTIGVPVWLEAGFKDKLGALCDAGMLKPVWTTAPYPPMPYSKTENDFRAVAHVYQRC